MQTEFLQKILTAPRPLFFHNLQVPENLAVVCLAPHPDDFDAIGVTMRKFRDNGNQIELGVVTSGASGVEDSFCPHPLPDAKTLIREGEQLESCRFFGLPPDHITFLRLEEDAAGDPVISEANIDRIRRFFLSTSPGLILMPHGNDSNAGHRRTYSMFVKLAEELKLSVLALLNRDPKTVTMRTDLFTSFGESDATWKARLLRFHVSQHQRNLNTRGKGFDERILGMNKESARAISGGESYAEAFEIEWYREGTVSTTPGQTNSAARS